MLQRLKDLKTELRNLIAACEGLWEFSPDNEDGDYDVLVWAYSVLNEEDV